MRATHAMQKRPAYGEQSGRGTWGGGRGKIIETGARGIKTSKQVGEWREGRQSVRSAAFGVRTPAGLRSRKQNRAARRRSGGVENHEPKGEGTCPRCSRTCEGGCPRLSRALPGGDVVTSSRELILRPARVCANCARIQSSLCDDSTHMDRVVRDCGLSGSAGLRAAAAGRSGFSNTGAAPTGAAGHRESDAGR